MTLRDLPLSRLQNSRLHFTRQKGAIELPPNMAVPRREEVHHQFLTASNALVDFFGQVAKNLAGITKLKENSHGTIDPTTTTHGPISSVVAFVTSNTVRRDSSIHLFHTVGDCSVLKECATRASQFTKTALQKARSMFEESRAPRRETMIPVVPAGRISVPTSVIRVNNPRHYRNRHQCRRRKAVQVYVNYMLHDRPMVYQNPCGKDDCRQVLANSKAAPVTESGPIASSSSSTLPSSLSDHDLQLTEFMSVLNTACKHERLNRM